MSIVHNALSLSLFRSFSSNSAKFSVIIENAVGYVFVCSNHSLNGGQVVGKCKILFFAEKCIILKWLLLGPELTKSVTNRFLMNISGG